MNGQQSQQPLAAMLQLPPTAKQALVDDWAKKAAMGRALMAKTWGLSENYAELPSGTQVNVLNGASIPPELLSSAPAPAPAPTPAPSPAPTPAPAPSPTATATATSKVPSWLSTAGTIAAVLAALAAGYLLKQPAAPPTQPSVVNTSTTNGFGLDLEQSPTTNGSTP